MRTVDDALPYVCVAKWNGELYVGGGPLGLFRRIGNTNQLDHIKPNVKAVGFDAREHLVITAENAIIGTHDGQTFRGAGINSLAKATGTIDIME